MRSKGAKWLPWEIGERGARQRSCPLRQKNLNVIKEKEKKKEEKGKANLLST